VTRHLHLGPRGEDLDSEPDGTHEVLQRTVHRRFVIEDEDRWFSCGHGIFVPATGMVN
jgi:hypothetical protein